MPRSSGRIAMQQWPRTCSLEIAGFRGVAGTEEFMARTEAEAVDLGATVHWGQRNNLTMKAVEQMYSPKGPAGLLFLWRESLSRLTYYGRLATFSTAFTRFRGLEVVQPKAYGLTVSPTNGCAGEAVSVTWDAEDNPPGTVAVLELRRPGFSNPHSIIPLPALAGTMGVVLPAGLYDFTLVVAYLLNDRSLTDERSVLVHGYADHDLLKFSAQAECVSIDGAVRWGFTRTLTSSFSPNLAVEELSCMFAPAVAWGVRRAGMPDLTFSPTNHVQQLPMRPALQGTWLFYLPSGVCSGTPPWFDAEFKLVCHQ